MIRECWPYFSAPVSGATAAYVAPPAPLLQLLLLAALHLSRQPCISACLYCGSPTLPSNRTPTIMQTHCTQANHHHHHHHTPITYTLLSFPQMPDLESDQPTTESPSHQHACLLILDALRTLLGRLDGGAGASEKALKFNARMR